MSCSRPKRRIELAELSWVQANYDQFDHLLFFNYFKSYNQRHAIRRFKAIVEQWIDSSEKKTTLLDNFNKCSQSKEFKIFWKQRAEREEPDSTSPVITYNFQRRIIDT
jgi:hypothetical protein